MNAPGPRWLLDVMAEPALLIGADGQILSVNRAAETLLHCRHEEEVGRCLGRDYDRLLPGRLELYLQALKSRTPRRLRALRLERGPLSGSRVDVVLQPSPEGELAIVFHLTGPRERNGDPGHLERRRLETALADAQLEIERLQNMRDEFLAVAAHELRTPLASMLAFSQLALRHGSALEPRVRRALDVVVAQCDRMKKLINEMLDVSRIQTGSLDVSMSPVNLAQIVIEVCDRMRLLTESHSFRLEGLDEPLMVCGDGARLEQAISNLVSNAVKFSPRGGEVLIEAFRDRGHLDLSITDRGVGIPEEAQPHVFEPFYRVNQEGSVIEGLGLGLPIVRHIVLRHGGEVRLRSELGCGTTFTVRLPLEVP